ncbi:MAG TPA: DNA recombination protein RmuC [Pirellulales bacterium]|nr:DNA recombination protein RmuC [Pirellulales bacterium]
MNGFVTVAALGVGIAVGAAVVWALMRAKGAAIAERLSAQQSIAQSLQQRETQLQTELTTLRTANTLLERDKAALAATLQQEREQEQKLKHAFQSLAAEALQANNQQFITLATSALNTQQEAAKGNLGELVNPVKTALTNVEKKLQDLEVARQGAYSGLLTQVQSLQESERLLRTEAANLVSALRSPTVRGRWGEMQLRRVVELAGMLDHCDFFEQVSTQSEDGRLQPDLVVCLPGNRKIVVDAKAPLSAFLEALDTQEEDVRQARMKDHARLVLDHVSKLKKKEYWNQFEHSPDFVVLFLPGETFFSAAQQYAPQLIELGWEQHVVIATPVTLITLLRMVALGWRQEKLAQNAQEISDLGKQLYERLAKVADHMRRLGKSLQTSVNTYNETVGTLESRVLTSARKFHELGAAPSGDTIDDVEPLEVMTREIQRLELLSASLEEAPSFPKSHS